MHPLHPVGLACARTLAPSPAVRRISPTPPTTPKSSRRPSLTAQQAAVARLAAEGRRDEDIGVVLGIARDTVKYHLQAVYRRLGVTSRVSLAAALGVEVRPTLAELTTAAAERGLNASQAEVLWHLLRGETNKVIARALKVSPPTVKLRLKAAYRATGTTRRAELAAAVRAWF